MKKLLAILLFALCGAANAATYYVCPAAQGTDAAGSDANTSTQAQSKATPWATVNQGLSVFGTMAAGDKIAMCDSGTFPGVNSGNLNNFNSTAANPIVITDYQSTGTLAPLAVTYSSATSTVLTVTQTLTGSAWVGKKIQFTSGAGIGAELAITANTTNTVTVAGWTVPAGTTFVPDATSVMVLRQPRPILNCSGSWCFFLTKQAATAVESYGPTFSNLDIEGGGLSVWGILVNNNSKNITIDNVRIAATGAAIQLQGTAEGKLLTNGSNGQSSHLTIKNSTIVNTSGITIGVDGDDLLIENNYIDHSGTTNGDHSIYLEGVAGPINPANIVSIVGNGTTTTVTTTTANNIDALKSTVVSVTGTSGGTGVFNVSDVAATYTSPTTFTYPSTGNGTATGGAYTLLQGLVSTQQTIRNNTITNASAGALGSCTAASIVVHGAHVGLLIENNVLREDAIPATNGALCEGIAIDSGDYWSTAPAEKLEGMSNVTIRGNTISNYGFCIGLDITTGALIENNACYTALTGSARGIWMRSKNTVPQTNSGSCSGSTLCTFQTQPNNVTIRNNTLYFSAAGLYTSPFQLNANIGDANLGSNYRVVSNVIWLSSGSLASTACFYYDNMRTAQFALIDYNECFTAGAATWASNTASGTAGQIANGATLAAFKVANPTLDQNSNAADPTITVPASTTVPPYKLVIPTSGGAYNTGSPTNSSPYAIGGFKRGGTGAPSKGAFEPNATVVLPGAPTKIQIQ